MSQSKDMKAADRYFSLFIRDRDQQCTKCRKTDYLQCAHLISRGYKSIRTDPRNAIALCRGCHLYFTHHPIEWEEWVNTHVGSTRLAELKKKALMHQRVDWKVERTNWREMCQRRDLL